MSLSAFIVERCVRCYLVAPSDMCHSQFLEVMKPVTDLLGTPCQGLSQAITEVRLQDLVPSEGLTREEPTPSSHIKLLVRPSSSCVAGLGAFAPCFPGRRPLSVPCHVGVSIRQLSTCQLA